MINKALFSSVNMAWCTPRALFEQLNKEFSFTLDAAATDKSAKCDRYFTPEADALAHDWAELAGGARYS